MNKLKANKITAIILFIAIVICIITILTINKYGIFYKLLYGKKLEFQNETLYRVNSKNDDIEKITIFLKNENGIESIITPENTIINCGKKKNVAIDYEVDINNTYTFKIKTTSDNNYKDYILDPSSDYMPEISQTGSLEYPLLTAHGIDLDKYITINYNSGTQNYYCIGNDEIWQEYTEPLNINKKCKVKAKTLKNGEITKIDEIDVTFNLKADAVGLNAYDENAQTRFTCISDNTAWNYDYYYMDVDDDATSLRIKISHGIGNAGTYSRYVQVYFLDSDGYAIKEYDTSQRNDFIIPEGTTRIKFGLTWYAPYYNPASIYEIKIKDGLISPMSSNEDVYGTASGVNLGNSAHYAFDENENTRTYNNNSFNTTNGENIQYVQYSFFNNATITSIETYGWDVYASEDLTNNRFKRGISVYTGENWNRVYEDADFVTQTSTDRFTYTFPEPITDVQGIRFECIETEGETYGYEIYSAQCYGYYQPADKSTYEFGYTGEAKKIDLEPGTYSFECWGASGARDGAGGRPGYGAYTYGVITLSQPTKIYVYVGGKGAVFNGGGRSQFTGGGATDFRLVDGNWNDSESLASRIMVAGAGAGNDTGDIGGDAGGLQGYASNTNKGQGRNSNFWRKWKQ